MPAPIAQQRSTTPKLPPAVLGGTSSSVSSRRSSCCSNSSGKSGHEVFANVVAKALSDGRNCSLTSRNHGVSLNLDSLPSQPAGHGRSGSLTARAPLRGAGSAVCSSGVGRAAATEALAGVGPLTLPSERRGSHQGNGFRRGSLTREDKELQEICETIGQKAAQKFRTVREAFRFLDADHSGTVDRSEVRYFFRAYDLNEVIADRFFDRLDRDRSGAIDFQEFVGFITPAIRGEKLPLAGCGASSGGSTREPSRSTSPVSVAVAEQRQQAIAQEFAPVLQQIRIKAVQRFAHAKEVFRYVDVNNDGHVSRNEMQSFFRAFNLPEATADSFFERLDEDASGEVTYQEFIKHVGPFIDLPGIEALQQAPPACAQACLSSKQSNRSSLSSRESQMSSSLRGSSGVPGAWTLPTVMVTPPDDAAAAVKGRPAAVVPMEQPGSAAHMCELRKLMRDIGDKLPLKFRHVRDAFRPLDVSRDGKIMPTEMRSFLRGFGWPEKAADRLFTLLDQGGRGYVDYSEFMAHFDEVLGPANAPPARSPALTVRNESLEREVNEIAALIGERFITKYRTAREAFRPLDLTNTGQITQTELRMFFRSISLPHGAADKVFRALLRDRASTVAFDDFVALFGATDRPGGRWRSVEELPLHTPRPAGIWRMM